MLKIGLIFLAGVVVGTLLLLWLLKRCFERAVGSVFGW